jgi:predicted ATPase/DNA-binding XRE family transcriptional regulator
MPLWYTFLVVKSINGINPLAVSLSDTKPIQCGEIMVGEDSFGAWLSKSRKSLGLTQKQLASQINCATITIRKIEAEQRRPSMQIAERLAQIFDIPANERKSFIRFARGDWRQTPKDRIPKYPWSAPGLFFRSHIPASLTPLIGRENEVSTLKEYLLDANIRLVTLFGPPGIGKSRLSQEVAQKLLPDFPDGIFFVPLTLTDIPNQLTLIILQSLGYEHIKGKSPEDALISGIAHKQMLLVLDNVEHLIDTAGLLVYELLQSCPHLKILATSREILRITGERIFPLSVLNTPTESQLHSLDVNAALHYPALKLFEERATAVQPGFSLTVDNLKDVAAICIQLDGLPLAIELLAAQIKIMTPHTLLEHLNNHLVLHTVGARSSPPHQKTLYHAINWSYNSLTDDEKYLFSYLSIFAGGFTLEAVEQVLSRSVINAEVTNLIISLLEKSLLQSAIDVYGESRFYLLTTIQQFAADKLIDSGEEITARQQHLAYFLKYASSAAHGSDGMERNRRIDCLDIEQDNFRAALNWSISRNETRAAIILLTILGWLWLVHGYYSEMFCWFDQVQSLPDIHAYPHEYAELLVLVSNSKWRMGEFDQARAVIEKVQEIWLTLGMQSESIASDAISHLYSEF